jgi:glucose/arabinose dehydrogenase
MKPSLIDFATTAVIRAGRRYVSILFFVVVALSIPAGVFGNPATPLTTDLVVSGLSSPVFVTAPPADYDRLFIVEQLSGQIKIFKDGALLGTPFLDIGSKIVSGGERGLLGLAFHPNYPDSGYFYIDYTRSSDGATVVARYNVSVNPDLADASSEEVLLLISQPYANHNGGMLAFGPNDGYLYIGMGDGGAAGDPNNNAQSDSTLLGKILRIDVDNSLTYSIPPSNPYYGDPDVEEEIWAHGVRNPWRYSFDRGTGDLYIGDVGQSVNEEIDFQPFDSPGGENYGWRCYEGNDPYNTLSCGPSTDYAFPIYQYDHSANRCAITGGYVYRGCAIPDLDGTYFFADYCTGEIWSFNYDGSVVSNFQDRTAELAPTGTTIDQISSFGEDAYGEIYIVDYTGGEIFKIVPDGVPSVCSSCGDVNSDGAVNIFDTTYLISYLYLSGPAPANLNLADVNNDSMVNIFDITAIISYLYLDGPPLDCP